MSFLKLNSAVIKLTVAYFMVQTVTGYENAYDLLERRNEKFFEYFRPNVYEDRNRFFMRPQHSGYATVQPYYSKFGNGYDNLGNGIGRFPQFGQRLSGWRTERRPFRERSYNNFDFYVHPTFGRSQDYGHHPTAYNTPGKIYGSDIRRKGNADYTKVDRFFEDNEDKKQKKTNELYQRSQEGVNVDALKKEKTGEQLRTDQIGENKSSVRSNKVVKKGRTTKGFAVHHHKDETGNSTTFFDEISDFGDQSDLRDIADGFGTRRTLEHVAEKGDEKYFKDNEEQSGNFGSGLLSGNQRFEKDFSAHEETSNKFHTGNGNDELGLRKTYQYLNGDRFEYVDPRVDTLY